MDFDNEYASSTTLPSLINLENNEDIECGEGYIIGANDRKLTFIVWKYFIQVQVGIEIKTKCGSCKKLFADGGKNETTHLKDRLKKCLKVKNNVDVK